MPDMYSYNCKDRNWILSIIPPSTHVSSIAPVTYRDLSRRVRGRTPLRLLRGHSQRGRPLQVQPALLRCQERVWHQPARRARDPQRKESAAARKEEDDGSAEADDNEKAVDKITSEGRRGLQGNLCHWVLCASLRDR